MRRPRGGLLAAIAAVLLLALAEGPAHAKVVAIGDIHGELDGFTAILGQTGLLDASGSWSGGDSTLVQLGDFTDRGAEVRAVMDLLRRLQTEAASAGGEAVVLLGNHEGMNLLGVFRDASPDAMARFADEDSETRRREGLAAWESWMRKRASWRGDPEPTLGEAERQAWLDDHPAGWIEYREALGPDGEYGHWLRTLPIAAVRADTLFMHAGLSAEWAGVSPEEITERHRESFEAYDRAVERAIDLGLAPFWADREAMYETLLDLRAGLDRVAESKGTEDEVEAPLDPKVFQSLAEAFDGVRWTTEADSPLWFRGYAHLSGEALDSHVDRVLAAQGVKRLVAGHSPTASHAVVRLAGDRVFLIDTGMLRSHYEGRASALVIDGDTVRVVYQGEGEPEGGAASSPDSGAAEGVGEGALTPRRYMSRTGQPLAFSDETAILTFLAQAPVVESEELGVGVTGAHRLVLRQGDVEIRAVFHEVDRHETGPKRFQDGTRTMFFVDSYRSQIAAYRLARIMGFHTVPPTVRRTVDGVPGSVQLWIEGGSTWSDRGRTPAEAGRGVLERWQLQDMWVFDNLIGNIDRNEGNILFDADGNLWWIDNTRAFSKAPDLPSPERVKRVSAQFLEALRGMDEETIRPELSELLTVHEIKALFKRRDRLLELLEQRIAEHGKSAVVFDAASPPTAVKVSFE